ncbi:hypothetical protein DEO72_LG8g1246 [Vigna unguiculata]|uniref:Uncharacterized protein n=1 Tax=Vigna unguiculata TaxID=3917 RepID=A0A4D6MR56_VIGUN|nr:hypothetical protein DEO72_LG8g1246 [Vigna unguiculata]
MRRQFHGLKSKAMTSGQRHCMGSQMLAPEPSLAASSPPPPASLKSSPPLLLSMLLCGKLLDR